ncbi:GNAT family N-acetyltransferase, partial [Ruoffia sp. FAM 24228]|uniref:GNAT family N-acetyltransferase n=1 Tax=Ruoffia sp. FAM 24228 TaxID=3259517 RepID=UPI003883AD5E
AVDPNYQGQGFGTQGIYQMMKQLNAEDERLFRLSVEKENAHAKHLYQKNGYGVISEVVYLKE